MQALRAYDDHRLSLSFNIHGAISIVKNFGSAVIAEKLADFCSRRRTTHKHAPMPLLPRKGLNLLGLGVVLALLSSVAIAQFRGGRARPSYGSGPPDRGNVPTWPVDENFAQDVFTFARLKYRSSGYERTSYAWWTDYPDADLNLSFRLQQLTALKVTPDPKIIEITDPQLFSYPWVFASGLGNIILDEDEAKILRKYLLNGGFLMVDDFWGQTEWDGFYRAIKKVFPEREPIDLGRDHPIFHCLFDLPNDRSLQTPNVGAAVANRGTGVTWEDNHAGGNTRDVHFRAILDDKKRMMVLICHNTDNGDGWEEETTDPWFFTEFSERKNYPLGMNIIFYAMTH